MQLILMNKMQFLQKQLKLTKNKNYHFQILTNASRTLVKMELNVSMETTNIPVNV